MKTKSKYSTDGKLSSESFEMPLTPLARMDEVYAQLEEPCECCGAFDDVNVERITASLTSQELEDIQEYGEVHLAQALLEGMMSRSQMIAGALLVNSNVEEIALCREIVDCLLRERFEREEAMSVPVGGSKEVN